MTVQELINWIMLIASFLGAVTTICVFCKKIINKGFEPIYKKMDKIDENQCRNYLVNFLSDMEAGIHKDEVQIKRAYEVYEHYTNDLHKNSYIHDKWTRLMK